ncbi:MAG TPA: Uma2 family endonuclease [Halomicronema sp.]
MVVTVESNPEIKTYSEEEYFELEVQSELRHEYHNGEIIEMTGGTPNHNRIALSLATILKFSLKRQPYDVFAMDQRLWIPDANLHTYPDVMVIREPLELKPGRKDTVMNPIFIAEVLSKSTGNYDRTDKFKAYRTISSLAEYLIIDQYSPHLEHYVKTDRGWLLRDVDGLEGRLILESIGVELELADLFDKVDFAAEVPVEIKEENT